jgi:hypothetical protein
LCIIPFDFKNADIFSDFSIDIVPTRTGCPFVLNSIISSVNALNFSLSVLYILSGLSTRCMGLFVGITTTSNPYIFLNSTASVSAVPVIPESLAYILKKFWKVIDARV